MEHIDLINKIIEAEQQAQKLAEEARQKRENMHTELKVATTSLRESYFERARMRIEKVRVREEAFAKEQITELDITFKKDLESIETAFKNNENHWVEKLFSMIVR